MRLINTKTLKLKEFLGSDIPEYAILSHTWGDDDSEISLQEMKRLEPSTQAKEGFRKIEKTCRLARRHNLDWAWVDTCCIDKTSSAELTEAINSMFQWYSQSSVCYAYLSDWKPATTDDKATKFADCRWFTRGWTLQELIAPRRVKFYDSEWTKRGTKKPDSLGKLIQEITGIPGDALVAYCTHRRTFSCAQRMSWASKRQTKRVEDIAYCLLGLFDINMPMIYGEGAKAFHRLQEQICRQSNDLTIFAWESSETASWNSTLFAPGPESFSLQHLQKGSPTYDTSVAVMSSFLLHSTLSEYSLTNAGLRVDGSLMRLCGTSIQGTDCLEGEYYFELGLLRFGPSYEDLNYMICSVGIILQKCGPGRFIRKHPYLTVVRVPISTFMLSGYLIRKRETRYFICTEHPIPAQQPTVGTVIRSLNPAPITVFRFDATTGVEQVVPETHWEIQHQFFFPANGLGSSVFFVFAKVPLPGSTGLHPIIIAIDSSYSMGPSQTPLLYDGSSVKSRISAWLYQCVDTQTVPRWSEFKARLGSESFEMISSPRPKDGRRRFRNTNDREIIVRNDDGLFIITPNVEFDKPSDKLGDLDDIRSILNRDQLPLEYTLKVISLDIERA